MNEHAEGQTDRELVRRVLAGVPEATEAFLERMRCVPRILGAKNARSGRPLSSEDLADLAQDVFSLVWRKLEDFRGEARLEAWVFPFCQLQYMNALRRKTRRPTAVEVDVENAEASGHGRSVSAASTRARGGSSGSAAGGPAGASGDGGGAPGGEHGLDPLDSAHVYGALDRLGEGERAVIRLKQFEDLTFEEIAARLGLSANTAKTRYYRGLARMRDLLGPRFAEEEVA